MRIQLPVLWLNLGAIILVSCVGQWDSLREIEVGDPPDRVLAARDITDREVERIVQFIKTRPYVRSLDRPLEASEVADLWRITRNDVFTRIRSEFYKRRYRVSVRAESSADGASSIVIHVEEWNGEFKASRVGESATE